MTLTAKDPKTTLSLAEQQELRRFMKEPNAQFGIRQGETVRMMLVESLTVKGYVQHVATRDGFAYFKLNSEQA